MNKKDEEPIPEIDESQLTEEQKEELHRKPNYRPFIIFAIVIGVLMIACMIVIFSLPKA